MKINYSLRSDITEGDDVVISVKTKKLEAWKKKQIQAYNIKEAINRQLNENPLYTFKVIDKDSVYQPNLSTDLPGVKIYHPSQNYWILPK